MAELKQAFIVGGVRSAIGSFGGSLSLVRADDLAARVIAALLERFPTVPKEKIDEVILGCANQAGEDNRNVARMSLLLAGIPETVPGFTVNRLCASGMTAVVEGARAIQCGEAQVLIAGGVESMTRAPFVVAKSEKAFSRSFEAFDSTLGWRFVNPKMKEMFGVDSMGETAENVAEQFSISRQDQDAFALRSQQKAAAAQQNGAFKDEIVALDVRQSLNDKKTVSFLKDEFIRPDSTIEGLSALKPAFRAQGTVTAGNSSGINDGACCLLLASEDACNKYNLSPLARLVGSYTAGVAPRLMGLGPVPACRNLLARLNLDFRAVDVLELNEAFAAQSIACLRQLGLSESDERLNPNGGAIALGHPLGMSGARIILSAVLQLQKRGKNALAAMCVGVGQGMALALEKESR